MEPNHTKRTSTQVMELRELIAGPLLATIDADSLSSRRYLDLLLELAFEKDSAGKLEKLRMLTFSYDRHERGECRTQQVRLPLLSLLPLPLLQVEEADFDFDIRIIDAFTEEREAAFSLKEGRMKQPDTGDSASVRPKLRVALTPSSGTCNTHSNTAQRLDAGMKVRVRMRQSGIPGGLANLLNLATNQIMIEEPASEPKTE